MDVGRCKGAFESWAYEVATGTCVEFKYTGCGGNQNRFGTKEACEALCLRPAGSEESAGEDFGKLGAIVLLQYTRCWVQSEDRETLSEGQISLKQT